MRRTGYIFVDYAEDEGRELLQNRCTEYRIPEVLKFHCLLSVNYIKCGRITQKCNGQTDAEDGHAALMPRDQLSSVSTPDLSSATVLS